jgi:hypothetical protein
MGISDPSAIRGRARLAASAAIRYPHAWLRLPRLPRSPARPYAGSVRLRTRVSRFMLIFEDWTVPTESLVAALEETINNADLFGGGALKS